MKLLFTVQPLVGHFHAMMPLALALKDCGHEVAFATGMSFGSTVWHVGFQHFPCGLDLSSEPNGVFETLPDWETVRARYPSVGAQQVYGFIQALGPRMADDVIELMKTWRPDVIVRDPLEFGGYIAAEHYGLPHATITWAVLHQPQPALPRSIDRTAPALCTAGRSQLNTLDRYLVFNFLPPAWQFPIAPFPPVTHRFCAPPFDASGDDRLPDWITALRDRPTIYATLGTTFNQSPATFQSILTALSSEDVNAIITVGRSMDPAQFQPLPAHIHIERYIPQTLILPHCQAILFHGGYNSLHSARAWPPDGDAPLGEGSIPDRVMRIRGGSVRNNRRTRCDPYGDEYGSNTHYRAAQQLHATSKACPISASQQR
jgi:UDP:flavonoid glycosyltransferase YjiC (YdhE family)